ncbi:MAG: two-component system invasion response regulator UvrY [Pseudohongiellaceae bacterium]|jgi:two-component system invasion response regulator UvrY
MVNDIRVILADDHVMMREGLAIIIAAAEAITVVAQADGGVSALAQVEEHKPDVLVLDYSMPDLDGPAVMHQLTANGSRTRVLFLTTHENVHYAHKALAAGALGFVVKSGAIHELVNAIRTVHAGQRYVSPTLDAQLTQTIGQGELVEPTADRLSQREFQLLGHLGQGRSLQEAAVLMQVTESTASTYRARLMKKLNLQNTAQIIRFAIENGITA